MAKGPAPRKSPSVTSPSPAPDDQAPLVLEEHIPDRSSSPHRSPTYARLLVPQVETALLRWDDVDIGRSAATILPYLGVSDPLSWLGQYKKLGAFSRRVLFISDAAGTPRLTDPIAHVIMEASISSGITDVGDLCHIAVHAAASAAYLSIVPHLHS